MTRAGEVGTSTDVQPHDDPVFAMKRSVVALALEVPEIVWADVRAKWNAVADEVKRLRKVREAADAYIGEYDKADEDGNVARWQALHDALDEADR